MPSNSQVKSIDTAGFITVGRKRKNSTAENEEKVSVKLFDFLQSFARIAVNANVFSVIGFGEESSKEEDEKYENLEVDDVEEDSSAPEQPETECFEDDKTLEQILDEMEWEIERDIERITTKSPETPVEMGNSAMILWKPTYISPTIQAPCKEPKMVRFVEKVEIIENEEKEEETNIDNTKEDYGSKDFEQIIVRSYESEDMRKDVSQIGRAYEAKKLELEMKKMDLQMKKMDYKAKKMDFKLKKMDLNMKKMELKMKQVENGMENIGDSMKLGMKARIEGKPSSFRHDHYHPSSMPRPSSKEKKEFHNFSQRLIFSVLSP